MGKKTVLENLDLVLITIDETVDDGCAAFRCDCPIWSSVNGSCLAAVMSRGEGRFEGAG